MTTSRRSLLLVALQGLASAVVLGLLLHDTDTTAIRSALTAARLDLVALALVARALTVTLHELRLWIALLPWRRLPVWRVLTIGWTAGLLNAILPMRGGDLAAMGMLRRELELPGGVAMAGVGITALIETVLFGAFALAVVALGATQWERLLGVAATRQARSTLTILTLGGVLGAAAVVLLSRRLRGREGPALPGPLALLRSAVVETGDGLSAWGPVAANLVMGVAQVALLIAAHWLLLPALGLSVPLAPLAICGLIALGSVLAVVLPPSLGAGPAAAAIAVLGLFGVDESSAIAWAALLWLANTLAPLALGIVPLLQRLPGWVSRTR